MLRPKAWSSTTKREVLLLCFRTLSRLYLDITQLPETMWFVTFLPTFAYFGFHNSWPLVEFVMRAAQVFSFTEKDSISYVENFQLPFRSAMRVYTVEVIDYASFLVQFKRLLGIFPKRTLPNIQQSMKNQPISPCRLFMYHSSPSIKFQSFSVVTQCTVKTCSISSY
jgi:hypothetical protein